MKKPIILIVEDDPDTRQELRERIEKSHHYQVITANDGVEGLKALNEHVGVFPFSQNKISCVILDHSMPKMTGLELINHIHSNGTAQCIRAIPFVMCTTYECDSELWRKPLEKGYITAFLSKVHIEDQLFRLLDRICVKHEANLVKRETQKHFFL